jgi:CRISPR-associated protein Cmr5
MKAFEKVSAVNEGKREVDKGKKVDKAKYKTFSLKMPSLIQTSGLIQALVFVESRGADGKAFCDDLAAVYSSTGGKALSHKTLREKAQIEPLQGYLALTADMIHVAIWFRRFAQIEFKDVDETKVND